MPLVAINQDTGKRIDLTDYTVPKIELQGNRFICPVCESRMTIRHGFKVSPHFAHLPSERCPYADYAAGETPEHKSGKVWLVNHLRSMFSGMYDTEITVEKYFREAGRIADVAMIFPGGYVHAYEIQLAGISVDSLDNRTRTYLDAGIDITWFIGNKADTPTNREWITRHQGEALIISIAPVLVKEEVAG